jgi:hypothetical protein
LGELAARGKLHSSDTLTVVGKDDSEDAEIRETLQKGKLEEMLHFQEVERTTVHKNPRQCLFCLEYSSSLKDLFAHMFREHHFNIGLLDNLVMVDEFLRELESLLQRNICIFCHCCFRSSGCLRKHMKNKRHYRIDPKNSHYDKYYIVNYIKGGGAKDEGENVADDGSDWDDLVETVDLRTTCLFCNEMFQEPNEEFLRHLQESHSFDFNEVRDLTESDFYLYIKAITYIRFRIRQLTCPFCEQAFEAEDELQSHLSSEKHCRLPDSKLWDKPQYLFPIYDDDPLLFAFEANDDDDVE